MINVHGETPRRRFLQSVALAGISSPAFSESEPQSLTGEIGVTTGSFFSHITFESGVAGKIRMLDLPKIMRDELDMRVVDLMSRTLESFKPVYLEKMRSAAADHGCVISNLKLNQRGIDIASADAETRREGMRVYRESIDRSPGPAGIRIASASPNPFAN
jgi:hypothetical protein